MTPLGQLILESLSAHLKEIERGESLRIRTVTLDVAIPTYSAEDVQRVRAGLGMSQAVFAAFLGVDAATIRAWEQGRREPSGMARRFLEEIEASPRHWKKRVGEKVKPGEV